MNTAHPRAEDMNPAGIVTRGAAAVVDLTVVAILMGSLYVGSVFVRLLFDPQSFTFSSPAAPTSISALIVISIGYLTLCWATTGRTVGAAMMGIRLVTPRRGFARWPLAALRAVLCVLFGFGLLWVAVDRRRRSLQDIVLRTSVVYDWSRTPPVIDPHSVPGQ